MAVAVKVIVAVIVATTAMTVTTWKHSGRASNNNPDPHGTYPSHPPSNPPVPPNHPRTTAVMPMHNPTMEQPVVPNSIVPLTHVLLPIPTPAYPPRPVSVLPILLGRHRHRRKGRIRHSHSHSIRVNVHRGSWGMDASVAEGLIRSQFQRLNLME